MPFTTNFGRGPSLQICDLISCRINGLQPQNLYQNSFRQEKFTEKERFDIFCHTTKAGFVIYNFCRLVTLKETDGIQMPCLQL